MLSQRRQTELTKEQVEQSARGAATEASAARTIVATKRQASAERITLEERVQHMAQTSHRYETEAKRAREGETHGKHNEQKEFQ